jgi:hypothetical protein
MGRTWSLGKPSKQTTLVHHLVAIFVENPSISQNKMSDNNKTYASVAAGKGGNKGKSPKSGKEWDKAVKELEKEKRAYLTPKQQS